MARGYVVAFFPALETASIRTGHFSYSLASPATVPRSSRHSPPSKNQLVPPMATITLHLGHGTCIRPICAHKSSLSSQKTANGKSGTVAATGPCGGKPQIQVELGQFKLNLARCNSGRATGETEGKSRSVVPAPLRHSRTT
jgi:hypothetical protein